MLIPHRYELKNKYPGMRLGDEVIWDEFVKNNPDFFLSVWYNVPLGEPYTEEEKAVEARANGGWDVSQWRIDVLGETADAFAAIEVRPDADARALGNAIAYAKLLKAEWGLVKPVIPVVLTNRMSPIMEKAAAICGVRVLVP
jgi:hypothetical protein